MTTKLLRKAQQTVERVAAASAPDRDREDILTEACAQFTLNDFGHVARLAVRHGDFLRFVPELGWVAYDGRRWDVDGGDQVARRLAQETLGDICDEADFVPSKKGGAKGVCPKKARAKYGAHVCTSAKVRSLLEAAQSHFMASTDEFDSNPEVLGVQNGVIDLKTGKLLPHDPSFMLTRLAAVEFDADAEAPRWAKFLEEVMCDDADLVGFLQELMGYAAFGHQKEEICVFFSGDETRQRDNGSNGKSVMLETLGKVFGEHKVAVSRGLIAESKSGSGIPNDLAKLRGARLAVGAEFKRSDVVDEERYKQATGGDTIQARFLNREFFDFRSAATPIFSTNTVPMLTGLDNGTKRRLLIVPFKNRWYRPEDCPPGEKVVDRHLEDKLEKELPGILAWIVAGAVRYSKNGGLTIPEQLIAKRDEKMSEFNPLGDFQSACLEPDDRSTLTYDEIAQTYRNWLQANGVLQREAEAVKAQWLGRRLTDIGCVKDVAETRRRGVGIRRGFRFSSRGERYLNGPVSGQATSGPLTVAAE